MPRSPATTVHQTRCNASGGYHSNEERKQQQQPLLNAAGRRLKLVTQLPSAVGAAPASPLSLTESLEPPRATPETLSADDCSSLLQQQQPNAATDTATGNRCFQRAGAGGGGSGLSCERNLTLATDGGCGVSGSTTPGSAAAFDHGTGEESGADGIETPSYDRDDSDVDEGDHPPVWSDLIRVNVSGQRFDFRRCVLERHPNTLLGNPDKRRQYYDARRGEYFFDRHRPSFEAIFAYYQYGGRLRRPHQVADDVFLAEVMFHEIEPEVVLTYKRSEGYSEEELILPDDRKLQAVWKLFEYPETSRAAFAIALVSVTATLIAIVLLCVETLPRFVRSDCQPDGVSPNWLGPFFVVESICHAWFTFELLIRLVACPSLPNLCRDFKTWVDVTALVPYYATLFNMLSTGRCSAAEDFRSSTSLAFLRVIRLVRIFKLTKHSLGLQVLILTFKASIEGLSMFLVALTVSMLVYSSALYYAEVSVPGTQIESIPDAFWWAIITMTTVGYGDKVPNGWMGRIIGAACAISGILTLAIPVPIIAGHFNRFYSHKTGRARLQLAT